MPQVLIFVLKTKAISDRFIPRMHKLHYLSSKTSIFRNFLVNTLCMISNIYLPLYVSVVTYLIIVELYASKEMFRLWIYTTNYSLYTHMKIVFF